MTNFRWRFEEEMYWRDSQSEPKPVKQTFYGRLACWYDKEDAILVGEDWASVVKEIGITVKKYVPTYSYLQQAEEEEEYTWIDITYPKEVAIVFRREFLDLIERLEYRRRQTEDRDMGKDLYDKIEFAKAELDIFNLYNPI